MPEDDKEDRSESLEPVPPDSTLPEDGTGEGSPHPETHGLTPRKTTGQEHPHRHKKKDLEAELDQARRERDELKDKYLRALADMDNLRKRLDKDKGEFFQFALAEALKDMLTVLDSLERALSTGGEFGEEGFRQGLRLTHKQFLDALARKGVTPIPNVVGGPFDPNLHQALTTETSEEVGEPIVAEELQRGYRLHDRLLRPALVKVRVPREPA